jgi:GTP-binding protein
LKGGNGGRGNWHFRTSVNQAPQYAQKGLPGKSLKLFVELDIIADVGFVGFPNAGKSTLLSVLTKAKPKIGSYPFTTKIPNLGVIHTEGRDIVVADIPGLINGASQGAGLGIKFLKHISRTSFLVFLIDLSEEDFAERFDQLILELSEFSPRLAEKKRIIVGTKLDMPEAEARLDMMKKQFPKEKVLGVSAMAHMGVKDLRNELIFQCRSERI